MGTSTLQSVLVALLALVLVAGPATAAVTAVAPASDTAEGLTTSGTVMAPGDLNQTGSGTLEFELDANEFNDSKSAVKIKIESDGGDDTLTTTAENPEADDVYRYRVASGELPDFSLTNTTIRVSIVDGEELLNETGVDLRHLDIADESASFNDRGRLTLNTTDDTAGIDGSFHLNATADGDDRTATLSATLENGTVTIDRNDAFKRLLAPPATLTFAATDGGPSITGDTGVTLADVAPDATVLVSPGRVTVQSPLLVADTEYGVYLNTTDPDGEYAETTTAEGTDGVTSVTVENEYVAGTDSVAVEVSTDGSSVLSQTHDPSGAVSAAVAQGNRSVTLEDESFEGDELSFVLLSTSSEVSVLSNASVDGATLSLAGLPDESELNPEGSYRMVVAFADAPSTTVSVGEGSELSALQPATESQNDMNGSANGSSGNESSLVPSTVGGIPSRQIGIGLGVGVLVLGMLGLGYAVGQIGGGSGSGSSTATQRTRDVRVRITDGFANERLSDEVYLTARPTGQSSASTSGVNHDGGGREEAVDGGVVTWTLNAEPYEFTASYNGTTVTETAELLDEKLTLSFQPVSKHVSVIDETGEPVEGATVTAEFDGERISETTDANGRASLTLPVTASSVEVTATHDRYEPDSRRVNDPNDLPSELRVVGKTGTLRLETAIGGEPTDAVNVSLDTDDEWLRERLQESSPTDEGDDAVGLPAGEYTLVGSVDGAPFEDVRSRVTVPEDDTTSVTLDVPFEYELSATQRESLEALRREADDLLPGGRLDSAIHGYYASVAQSLADAVERVPESGTRFAETGVEPDPVVDATLSAGRGCVEGVDNAMNTKHNVDLFSACADMREASEEWRADYDLDDLFELAAADRVSQRAELKSKLSEAESTVEDNRGEVNVISPAGDVLEELQAYESETRESDEVRNAAFVFAVAGFAEAVSELFEHPRLLDRLNRTMY
ncbi:carboxypeptidase regulatory-like domain-containing protein [Halobaculum roseum]|uniref:Carboxypeptidase regulatory-like domain-containing protein n=1 Tax=Halobaculum roseum TaxID=2175149 RepID=A0ABD5MQ67_9EURY|nr:carboxypeptidase regulatory-like domain-containing protein [Halobaculum roseum]QZY04613.1 carboxypeptidase regulatory-like domain-containing protein [Halobaculum roseum]